MNGNDHNNEQTPLITSNGDGGDSNGTTTNASSSAVVVHPHPLSSPFFWSGFTTGTIFMICFICAFFVGIIVDERYHNHHANTGIFNVNQNQTPPPPPPSEPTHKVNDGSSENENDDNTPNEYIGTQFISFTINTIGGLAKHGECLDRDVDENGVCYLGNSNNITEDLLHRLNIVQRVLNKIKDDQFKESPDIDHADNILKIVTLPEFFFRGPKGAYDLDELFDGGGLRLVGDILRQEISHPFFNDFLFVFGTVIAARSADDNDKITKYNGNDTSWETAAKANDIEYYNFAAVAKGGTTNSENSYVVTKRYISGADFLSRTTLPNPSDSKLHHYAKLDTQLEEMFKSRNTTVITNNVININGLRIGIEICLDHRVGTLWNTLRVNHEELVDVLIVTSAGMAIERGPNPIVNGGVVYLSDGEASSAACMRTDDVIGANTFYPNLVCRQNVGGLKHVPVGGPGYSSFIELSACWDMENLSLLDGYYSLYQTQGCAYTLKTYDIDVMDEYKYYPPSIEIYPTISLPSSAYGNSH